MKPSNNLDIGVYSTSKLMENRERNFIGNRREFYDEHMEKQKTYTRMVIGVDKQLTSHIVLFCVLKASD